MQHTRRIVSIGTAVVCVVTGGAIGISQSAAAGSKGSTSTKASSTSTKASSTSTKASSTSSAAASHQYGHRGGQVGPGSGFWGGFAGGFGAGGAVHSVSEELDKAGTAYIAVTTDNGTITTVDKTAGSITLKEGTSKVTYATPTLTIPSSATVILNGSKSSLSDLASGDHITVTSSSEGTTVFATNSSLRGGPTGSGSGAGNWSGSGAGNWSGGGAGNWSGGGSSNQA